MAAKAQITIYHLPPSPSQGRGNYYLTNYQSPSINHLTIHQLPVTTHYASAQNKPNFKNNKINTNYYRTSLCDNLYLRDDLENKPNQTQFKAIQTQISKKNSKNFYFLLCYFQPLFNFISHRLFRFFYQPIQMSSNNLNFLAISLN